MSNTIVTLKKGEGRTIKAGGAWVFDNEIANISGHFKNGAIVEVQDFDGYCMGYGYINQNSKIRVRMMTRKQNVEIDEAFIFSRVEAAWNYRKNVMHGGSQSCDLPGSGNLSEPDLNCCRVIFGEADFLPGITVDKYSDILVVESLTLGIEQFKDIIVKSLITVMEQDGVIIRAVVERSDAKERIKEGLKRYKGLMWIRDESINTPIEAVEGEILGFSPLVEIVENDVHYIVDVLNGQKTGFFLDQKYNRQAIKRLCKGKRVLDCFTHMGTFALNAGIAGASEVTGLDISEFAIAQATANAKLNGLSDTVKFRCANVLDELPRLAAAGEKYDVVILDPPAFTKAKEATKNAIKGYREINMKGLKLVEDGGFLATCSCSHFMTQELFTQMMHQAAKAVHKRLRQVEFRTQAADHPILWNNASTTEESYYLKFYIFQVVDEK